MNQLDQLKQFTTVVADTGNFKELAAVRPARRHHEPVADPEGRAVSPTTRRLLAETVAASTAPRLDEVVDEVLVRFGLEILKVVPGRVSTEVDARLSFDTAATRRARAAA